eukprot:jgi/Psemu1/30781/gm1.30781_g
MSTHHKALKKCTTTTTATSNKNSTNWVSSHDLLVCVATYTIARRATAAAAAAAAMELARFCSKDVLNPSALQRRVLRKKANLMSNNNNNNNNNKRRARLLGTPTTASESLPKTKQLALVPVVAWNKSNEAAVQHRLETEEIAMKDTILGQKTAGQVQQNISYLENLLSP